MKQLMLSLLGFFFYFQCFAQVHSGDTLYVECVSFNIESIISVPCTSFEENFGDRIQLNVVTNKDTLAIFESFLRGAKYQKRTHDIDVRAKFLYHKEDGTSIKICMSKFDIIIDGRLMKESRKIYDFLRRLAR